MKAYVVSMGCPKNTVDSEAAITILKNAGCTMTSNPRSADLYLVNSCSFLDAAWRETVGETKRLAHFKRGNEGKKLLLMGCLPVHRNENLEKSLPWVDYFLPPGAHAALPRIIKQLRSNGSWAEIHLAEEERDPFAAYENRDLLTPGHTAYVKVAEGCDRACTFCAIPAIRGPLSCRPPASILREIESLLKKGVREVMLVAQDILSYHSESLGFSDLVREIAKTGIDWIRIFYMHPESLTIDIVRQLFDNASVCRYLEVPVQHASGALLKRMRRAYDQDRLNTLFSKLRVEFPDVIIRSEVVVGFPGETERDFEILKEFIVSARFASLGIFSFSPEQGTEAASLGELVPEGIVAERIAELSTVQDTISFDFHSGFKGEIVRVLVDREVQCEEGIFTSCSHAGRFYGQAYEIDGEVYLKGKDLKIGDFVTARIVDTDMYDLKGEVE